MKIITVMLPNGNCKRIKENELPAFLKKNKLQLHQPSYQGSSMEEAQIGIKHN
jgi:hypothetical protein